MAESQWDPEDPARQQSYPNPREPDNSPGSSSLTTKELQQNWREVKQRQQKVKLLFEIPSTRIVQKTLSKHVVYQVVVIRSGSYDSRRVSVERRYSDFSRFHQRLLEEFSEELGVSLPRKLLTGNFSPEIISERRLALQDYLAKLYAVRCVRYSPRFPEFLTEPEQRQAHCLLRAGQFRAALELLQNIVEILEKLAQWQSPVLLVPALCALAICHRDLEEPEQALATAQRALPPVRRYGLNNYRAPLLEMMVDLGYQLGRPVAQLQEELTGLRDAERGPVSFGSLKELVVQGFT
ncbi:LOW QUALITY PROTEIN: sorting nexin-20 [Diretmus argenteus]